MPVTLQDIADHLGLSIATVSRALSDVPTVAAKTRARVLAAAECQFAYRHSIFKASLRDQVVITAIELRLSRSASVDIQYPALASFFRGRPPRDITPLEVFDAVVSIRRSRLPDPSVLPNVGSFFKNPLVEQADADALLESFPGLPVFPQPRGMVKLAAAWLIEHCGWKGCREGDVGVHPDHALVLVNYGEGTGEQLLSLAARITTSVREVFGLDLAIEPRVYGDAA